MKGIILILLITCLALVILVPSVSAQHVTEDEALIVGKHWLTLMINQKGDWGGSSNAEIINIQEFKRGDRLLGYYCPIRPQGFLVLSLRKELMPIAAYSETSDINPYSDEGLTDLIKLKMEGTLNQMEMVTGPLESVSSEEIVPLLEFNFLQSWELLGKDEMPSKSQLQSGILLSNYEQGDILLTSTWHQQDPYNRWAPPPPPGSSCTWAHCAVGCSNIASGQDMRYWNWPPYHDNPSQPYNWVEMPDYLSIGSTQSQIDAVARLVYEIGIEAGSDWCGGGSPCETTTCWASCVYPAKDTLDAFEDHFRYSTNAEDRYRNDYFADSWYALIKKDLNLNRPIPYLVKNHAIVCDGWKEYYIGSDFYREYHLNYGGALAASTWYALDQLPPYDPGEEGLLENIYPAQSLGNSITGTYSLQSFPYRYFDQDTLGDSAFFSAGQNLQFLPGITVSCNSGTGSAIRFEGSDTSNTLLYTRGDKTKGIQISGGALELTPGGELTLL
ncbi:MAG: Peptidase C10 family protein [Euryarchaeota archaeon ADurb.BinA087]|nr:MAG: Peptidase C10 family protein [Euryarchaeota archaeon ADurb.BinA087]